MMIHALFVLLCLLMASASPALAAIDFVSVTNAPTTAATNIVTQSVTVLQRSNLAMLACIQTRDSGGDPSSKAPYEVSFNTTEQFQLVRADTRINGSGFGTSVWVLPHPTATTADAVVRFPTADNDEAIGVSFILFEGVDQTTPIEAHNGASGSSGSPGVTVTSLSAQAWIMDCILGRDDAGLTVGSGQTERVNRQLQPGGVNDVAGVSTVDGKADPGPETMDWTQAASDFVMSAVALKPAENVIAVVQVTPICYGDANAAAVCTFASAPSMGNTIIVLASKGEAATIRPTCAQFKQIVDPQTVNSYDLAVESPATSHVTASVWYRYLMTPPSGSFSVSLRCNTAGSTTHLTMVALEVSGLLSVFPHDVSGWNAENGGTALSIASFFSTTQANELAVAALSLASNSGGTTPSAGWTEQFTHENCATHQCGSGLTQIRSMLGTPSASWTFAAASNGSSAALATFRGVTTGSILTVTRSLAWVDNATNEASYTVQKKTDLTAPNWIDVASLPAGSTAYSATLPITETGDCWRVLAVNAYGTGTSNEACYQVMATPPVVLPPPPVLQIGGLQWLWDEELL